MKINPTITLVIFAVIIIFIIGGMLYFFGKGKTTTENEEWGEFLWTIDNLQTFLIIIIAVCTIIGFILFRIQR